MNTDANKNTLSRDEIVAALQSLNDLLAVEKTIGEICLFGGAVMVLAYNARPATKDIDAIFQPAGLVRELAKQIGATAGFPDGWLNDGVKGYLSAKHSTTQGTLPQFGNLRVLMPTAEYLLAMKCLASRIGGGAGEADDIADIVFLIRNLKLDNPSAVLDVLAEYYPLQQIPVRSRFLIETLFDEGQV